MLPLHLWQKLNAKISDKIWAFLRRKLIDPLISRFLVHNDKMFLLSFFLISVQIHISDLHQWKFTADNYLENKELGRDWKHGNKKWETKQIGDTDSVLVADAESGNALSLIMDKLQIGIEVNPAVEDQTDTKQKWDLAKDKRTGWMKLKKPNGFFLESSECDNNLFIQGMYS